MVYRISSAAGIRLHRCFSPIARALAGLLVLLPGMVLAAPVSIPDPALRAVVESALGKSPGDPIDSAEMAALTQLLQAFDKGIASLTGLEHAVNLVRLDADQNQISDLSPLAGLVQLKTLWLLDNLINDLTPLSGLPVLDTLILSENQISDIAPLGSLALLRRLDLSANRISDLPDLSGLAALDFLNLQSNRISDIAALGELPALSQLYIEENYLDIAPGSDDRAILDGLNIADPFSLRYTPQRPMYDYAYWAGLWNPDPGAPAVQTGPLAWVNLLAFSMGLDPHAVIPGQTPTVARTSANAPYRFRFLRDLRALGLRRAILVSPDLVSWTETAPDRIDVLSDDGSGVQHVEAVFNSAAPQLYFQLLVEAY